MQLHCTQRTMALLAAALNVLVSTHLCASMNFTDVTSSAGITHAFTHLPADEVLQGTFAWQTGGAVAEDFDGDGWIDLYALQANSGPNLLYMNQGNGTFLEEAAARGAAVTGIFSGCAAADYDNDGDIDMAVSRFEGPHYLLINDGSGHFSVDTNSITIPNRWATSPSWADIDNDGDLDLALGSFGSVEHLYLYINDGTGGFVQGQILPVDYTYTPAFADLDGDRYPELLAVADAGHAAWYTNDRGIFEWAGRSDIRNGMGTATGDIDNDGDLDWFMTAISANLGNRMLLNDGAGNLTDATDTANVRNGNWGWGAAMADFDLDGDLDIYHVNGWLDNPAYNLQPAVMFENNGSGVFTDISAGAANNTGQGRAVVVFDFDNDGDQDIFIVNNRDMDAGELPAYADPGTPVLLRNDSTPANHWLTVSLQGEPPRYHLDGIGARIYVESTTSTQMRELNASSGYLGHGPARIAHFGFGNNTNALEVRTVWNNGDEVLFEGIAVDQALVIESPLASASTRLLPYEGGNVLFEIDALLFPPEYTIEWYYGGVTKANPAWFGFSAPGEYKVELRILDGNSLVRKERIAITVVEEVQLPGTIARVWNEQNLAAIRIDFPNPTKHARNLFHTSIALWDAWAAYSSDGIGYLHREPAYSENINAARNEAISFAAYRILKSRYSDSVNGSTTLLRLDRQMAELGYDVNVTTTEGSSPAALGNRIAQTVLNYYAGDGWDVYDEFMGGPYTPTNDPLDLTEPGTVLLDFNRWQPLLFVEAIAQNGLPADVIQTFLGPNWGAVRPFAHSSLLDALLHLDPGPPPQLGGIGDADYKAGNLQVIAFSSSLDPDSGVMIDISPGALGNNTLGLNDGTGHPVNPSTGLPYTNQVVKMGDFGRVLAEFWADGPDSETPPGHWNTMANDLVDHESFTPRYLGEGDPLDPLEWDVKMYFAMNGALHDAAIAAWGCKRVYDYIRPISSIRYMASMGQSTDPSGPSYHPLGIPLVTGLVEVVTAESSAPGQRHEHLSDSVGSIAIRAWQGESWLSSPTDYAGVGWILAEEWMPYQRSTFVTPAFPGYVSGHSTFSRAAAEVLAAMTGSPYFPGGLGSYTAHANDFLEFEEGPSTDIVLQWATYYDAADQAGISRIYGGIHVPADDGPGRMMGAMCGMEAWALAKKYFDGSITNEPFSSHLRFDLADTGDLDWEAFRGSYYQIQHTDSLTNEFTNLGGWIQATETVERYPLPEDASASGFFRVMRSFDVQANP